MGAIGTPAEPYPDDNQISGRLDPSRLTVVGKTFSKQHKKGVPAFANTPSTNAAANKTIQTVKVSTVEVSTFEVSMKSISRIMSVQVHLFWQSFNPQSRSPQPEHGVSCS